MKRFGGKFVKLNTTEKIRKSVMGFISIAVLIVAFFSVTYAWLKRSSLENFVSGPAVEYKSNLTILSQKFSAKSYYMDFDGTWKFITEDYVRFEDKTKNWSVEWDTNSALLYPGNRTEFRTVIKNISSSMQTISVCLNDVTIPKVLAGAVVFGAYEPFPLVYDSSDESISYEKTDEDGNTILCFNTLPLINDYDVESGSSLTIRWYVSVDADISGGKFFALTNAEGDYIKNGENYYSVNHIGEQGKVTQAFLCNEKGELIIKNGQLVPYTSYDDASYKEVRFGNTATNVRISGMKLSAG